MLLLVLLEIEPELELTFLSVLLDALLFFAPHACKFFALKLLARFALDQRFLFAFDAFLALLLLTHSTLMPSLFKTSKLGKFSLTLNPLEFCLLPRTPFCLDSLALLQCTSTLKSKHFVASAGLALHFGS